MRTRIIATSLILIILRTFAASPMGRCEDGQVYAQTSQAGSSNIERTGKSIIDFQIPRVSLLFTHTDVMNVPDGIRLVTEYNRPGNVHELPTDTNGMLSGVSIGLGMMLANRFELAYDLAFRESFFSGRDTWSEIGFPSDDYLGYRYNGMDSNLTAAVRLIRGAYFRTGVRFYHHKLSSGSDAFNQFNTQNSIKTNDEAYILGAGYKFLAGEKLNFDLEFEFSDSFDNDPRVQTYSIIMRYTALPWKKPME